MKPATLTVVGVTLALALSSCALLPPAPPAPSITTTETGTPSPTPTPEPAVPEARTGSTPFDEWDAYLACRQLTVPYFYSEDGADFFAVVYDSFAESVVHERPDGLFYVYSEVENGNGDPALANYAAANCIIGGTLDVPRYDLFGATARLTPAEIADAQDAPLATE